MTMVQGKFWAPFSDANLKGISSLKNGLKGIIIYQVSGNRLFTIDQGNNSNDYRHLPISIDHLVAVRFPGGPCISFRLLGCAGAGVDATETRLSAAAKALVAEKKALGERRGNCFFFLSFCFETSRSYGRGNRGTQ